MGGRQRVARLKHALKSITRRGWVESQARSEQRKNPQVAHDVRLFPRSTYLTEASVAFVATSLPALMLVSRAKAIGGFQPADRLVATETIGFQEKGEAMLRGVIIPL